jgi:hypothetical protein
MAREAGLIQESEYFYSPREEEADVHIKDLKAFEALVRADERGLAAPTVQEPVGVFVEDDDIGHVRLIPHQQLKLKDGDKLYTTPPAAQSAPVAWKWHQAPVKTSWGHDMVVADLAIDKDNTVSVYCERDQTTKVEAMFTPPAAPVQEPVVQEGYTLVTTEGYEWAKKLAVSALAQQAIPLTELQKDATNLLFALHDAWPYVHQHCTIQPKKKFIQALIVKHGDFADLQPPAAQRQWVGLAHKEIAEIVTPYWDKYCDFDFEQFTQDIEAKLKEKNNG